MINKNQYEKSIIRMNTNIPVFVRNMYANFVGCLDELTSEYLKKAQENPYSVNECAKNIIDNRNFFNGYTNSLPSKIVNLKLEEIINNTTVYPEDGEYKRTITQDEKFYTVNGPDIYAPLTCITAKVTPFCAIREKISSGKIPICFEPGRGWASINQITIKKQENGFDDHSSFNSIGMNGTATILDNLESKLIVDIDGLFNAFFNEIAGNYSKPLEVEATDDTAPIVEAKSETDAIEALSKILITARSEKSSEVVDKISALLLKEACATYFAYAAKLIGAKNDIYQWMYTSFVKDSVSTFDQTIYPTRAPVTLASGHAVSGNTIGEENERDDGGNPLMTSAASDNDYMLRLKKILIYRNIRMQYSVWAAIINGVLSVESASYTSSSKYDESKIRSDIWSYNLNSKDNSVVNFTREALFAYVTARYRTYNTITQLDFNKNTLYLSVKNIDIAINKIKDLEAATIVKDQVKDSAVKDVFIESTPDTSSILTLTNESTKQMRKLVLHGCYLVMLAKMFNNIGKAKDDIEPETGRSRKDLFCEIFMGIANNINETLHYFRRFAAEEYRPETMSGEVHSLLNDVAKYYTPFTLLDFNRCCCDAPCGHFDTIRRSLSDLNFVSESLNKLTTKWDDYEKNEQYILQMINSTVYDIPVFAEYNQLNKFDNALVAFGKDEFNIRNGIGKEFNVGVGSSTFPKNKVIIEGFEQMNTNEHRMFNSLESVNSAIDELRLLQDLSFEGADAMASNACYNQLASVCSGITSLEITNEETAEKDKINVSGQYGSGNLDDTRTDADGNIIKEGTSDALDQANLTRHSVESAHASVESDLKNMMFRKSSNEFNDMFNKIILDLK